MPNEIQIIHDDGRFWSKVDVRGPNECWPWTAGTRDGYGQFKLGGKNQNAHRVAYELSVGPISDGLFVCHSCDERACQNPAHFFLGTNTDNMQDAMNKGRLATGHRNGRHTHPECTATGDRNGRRTYPELTARGERNGKALLTEAKVRAIRSSYLLGSASRAALARLYGITWCAINSVLGGRTWRHVEELS